VLQLITPGEGEAQGLAVKFDLDLFMTGHDLWATTATAR
jgi:hypothetical protein